MDMCSRALAEHVVSITLVWLSAYLGSRFGFEIQLEGLLIQSIFCS